MNKKVLLSILSVVLVLSVVVFAACSNNSGIEGELTESSVDSTADVNNESNNAATGEINNAADVINKVIETYAEDKKFAAMGGTGDSLVDGKAGLIDISDKESINGMLHTTDELIEQTDEVASFIHGMNVNTFTSGSFKLKDADSAESFCSSLKKSVLETQWMCGFPDEFILFSVNNGEYVVYAVGNAEAVDYFQQQFTTVMGENAVLVAEEAIK